MPSEKDDRRIGVAHITSRECRYRIYTANNYCAKELWRFAYDVIWYTPNWPYGDAVELKETPAEVRRQVLVRCVEILHNQKVITDNEAGLALCRLEGIK